MQDLAIPDREGHRLCKDEGPNRAKETAMADHNISMGHCIYNLWHAKPRRINEETIRKLYPDQFNLMMNRLSDSRGWKPLVATLT